MRSARARAHAGRHHRQSPTGGSCGWGPGARAPPARGTAAGRGAARGGTDARALGPRRRCRHFVSSAQWERVTAERGSEAGEGGMNQVLVRRDRAERRSAGLLRPCSPLHLSWNRAEWEDGRGEGQRREQAQPPPHWSLPCWRPLPRLQPPPPSCHSLLGSAPKSHAVRTGLLSPTAMARRGGGGAGAGGERAGGRAPGRCGAT